MSENSIPRRPDHIRAAPLSYAQEGILLTERVLPEFARYTGARAFRLSGTLDEPALAHAVVRLVDRHEGLCSNFTIVDGKPLQWVPDERTLHTEVVDLRDAPDPAAAAARFVDAAAVSRFDLSSGPLFRVVVLRTGADTSVLLLVAHHIIIDLLSWPILLGDLREFYRCEVDGDDPALADLAIRPADYAAWQRARETRPEIQELVADWCRRLVGIPPLLDLPTDRRRGGSGKRGEGVLRRTLPAAAAADLSAVTRSERTTLLATSLAALGALLLRYTRQDQLTIGLPVAGDRFRPEVESLVGMFVTSFAVPLDLRGDVSFRQLIRRTKSVVFEAMANLDAPYELLMQTLKPVRRLGTVPYQQVSLNIRYPETRSFTLRGLDVTPVPVQRWFPLGDLTLTVDASSDPIELVWIYDSELYAESTVAAMAEHYQAFLLEGAREPDRRISGLGLGPGGDASPRTEASPVGTIHARFAAYARRDPHALAVAHGADQLSYSELDRRADAIAATLRQRGVRREDPVGVCLPRSINLVVAYLGILKAGGAYVPLDPDLPDHRLAEMLRQVGAELLITEPALAGRAWPAGMDVLLVDDVPPDVGDPSADRGHTDSLAYIMFTSGSTGQPRGVAIAHRGVLGLVVDANHVQIKPGDRVAQTANHCSDNTTFELWAPLLNGGSVHILDRPVILSPGALAEAIEKEGIGILSVASALVNHEGYADRLAGAPLAALYFGGEAGNPHAVRTLLDRGFRGQAVHTYGPTETTMLATYEPVGSVPERSVRIPVGRPVSATEIYVMDCLLRPLPAGVPGELCVGGDRLARGYAKQPGLTADRFCPNPVPGRTGQRLYRTGDLARQLPDGRYEVLGRMDRQLKVRGFRVEPGEVEGVLAGLPGVAEAVVTPVPAPDGGVGLAGYVSPEPGRQLAPAAMLGALRETLPEYLVPWTVVVLPRLPLTPTGKVDHGALPAPSRPVTADPGTGDAPAMTGRERLIADLVTEMLGLDSIGPHDDFQAHGGNSLFVVQLLMRMEELGIDIPVSYLLNHMTVAGLAAWYDHQAEPAQLAVRTGDPTLVMISVEGTGFSYGPWLAATDGQYPRRLLDVEETDGRSLARLAVEQVEALRQDDGLAGAPVAFAGWSAGGVLAHEMARVWHQRVGELVPVLMVDATARTPREPPAAAELLNEFLHDMALSTGLQVPPVAGEARAPQEVLAEVIAGLRRRGLGYELHLTDLLARYDAFCRVSRLVRKHDPDRYPGSVCFVEAAESSPKAAYWVHLCGSLEVTVLPGNHYTVLRAQPERLVDLGAKLLGQARASQG